jgi:phage-related protein
MDKKLLNALNNLSYALEEISDALAKSSDKTNKSATTAALQSNDLGQKVTMIDKGVKQLIEDNKKILKNQETIISLAKEKGGSGGGPIDATTDPKQKGNIKDGLSIIMMIAVGVLAIGLAFKIVGGIDFGSVIALAIALPLVAIAFEKIAKMKDLNPGEIKNIIFVVLGISAAIVGASFILKLVQPIGLDKLFTTILITGMFVVLSTGISKLLDGVKDLSLKGLFMLPLVMLGVSLAIAGSSFILQLVKPIGLDKLFTTILIAAMFTVVSMNIKKLLDGVKDIDLSSLELLPLVMLGVSLSIAGSSFILQFVQPVGIAQLFTSILIAGMFAVVSMNIKKLLDGVKDVSLKGLLVLPLVMVAVSLAIVGSSYLLQFVQPVGIAQLFTAVMIAAVFSVIAFGLAGLAEGINKIGGPAQAAKMAILLPVVLVGVAAAIVGASHLFSFIDPISIPQFLTAIAISIIFIPISFALPFLSKAIANIDMKKIALLPVIMIAMALAIVGASLLFQYVEPIDPGVLFNIVLIGLTISIVSVAMSFALIALNKFNIGIKEALVGGVCIILIAGAIAVSSLLLSLGKYGNAPSAGWAIGFSLAVLFLAPAVIRLGLAGLPVVTMGAIGLVIMAAAITAASYILALINPDFFYTLADAFSYFMKKIAEAIGYGLKVIAPGLKFFIDTVGDSLIRFAKNIIPVIVGAVEMLMDKVVKPFIAFIMPFLPTIVKLVISVVQALTPVFKMIVDLAKSFFEAISTALKIFKDIIVEIGNAVTSFIEEIGNVVEKFFNGIATVIKTIGDSIVNIVKAISGGIKDALGKVKEVVTAIGDSISKVIDAIGNSFAKIGNSIATVINSVVGGIERLEKVGTLDLAASALKIGEFLIAVTGYVATFTSKKYDFTNFNSLKTLFDSVTNLTKSFGTTDPFAKIGNSIDSFLSKLGKLKVAKENPFKQLSDSVEELVNSMSKLNTNVDLDKLSAINSLTGSIVMLSLMDSEQFSKMMDALEDKSKILLDVMENVSKRTEKSEGSVSMVTPVKTGGTSTPAGKSIDDLYNIMAMADQKLGSIQKSNENVSKYINEIRSGEVKLK